MSIGRSRRSWGGICISSAWPFMAGDEEIQVWVDRSGVLDMKTFFGSNFIKTIKLFG